MWATNLESGPCKCQMRETVLYSFYRFCHRTPSISIQHKHSKYTNLCTHLGFFRQQEHGGGHEGVVNLIQDLVRSLATLSPQAQAVNDSISTHFPWL